MIGRHFATEDFNPIDHEPRQLVLAANGVFFAHVTRTMLAVVRVFGFAEPADETVRASAATFWDASTNVLRDWLGLRPLDERLELRRRLPAALKERMLTFHRRVWARHETESLAILYTDPETGEYHLEPPLQRASRARVETDPGARFHDGWLRVGTSHSHPCGAFHSGVDRDDEARSDGLHLVVGHLDRAEPDIIATLVVRGHRRSPPLDEVFEPDDEMETWLGRVQAASRRSEIKEKVYAGR